MRLAFREVWATPPHKIRIDALGRCLLEQGRDHMLRKLQVDVIVAPSGNVLVIDELMTCERTRFLESCCCFSLLPPP